MKGSVALCTLLQIGQGSFPRCECERKFSPSFSCFLMFTFHFVAEDNQNLDSYKFLLYYEYCKMSGFLFLET